MPLCYSSVGQLLRDDDPTLVLLSLYVLVRDAAANETCPQPQTSEHLAAIGIMKLNSILVLQNKIDLVREAQAKDQYQQIIDFVKGLMQCYRRALLSTTEVFV